MKKGNLKALVKSFLFLVALILSQRFDGTLSIRAFLLSLAIILIGYFLFGDDDDWDWTK